MKVMKYIIMSVIAGFLIIICQISLQAQRFNPVAVNDTADITPGIPVTLNLLANDTIIPGDSIRVIIAGNPGPAYLNNKLNPDRTVTFVLDRWGYSGIITKGYSLKDVTQGTVSKVAMIYFRVHDNSFAYLDLNNIRARISASGLHFNFDSAQFEVPKGSGKTAIYAHALWIGGLDGDSLLHLAGETYQMGTSHYPWTRHDYWAGPVSDSTGYNIYQDSLWNRVWKISREEINFHRNHFWEPGYHPPINILEWPAHGDTSLGQAFRLAPYSDRNANGLYEPLDGDYPEIRGDQALFFIFNDDRGKHRETGGNKLKVEIHGLAYAFDLPSDTAFKNTVFLHYKIINRSPATYNETYIGVFTDIDLGFADDDHIGCDVERGMFYNYNGKPADGTGQPWAYGENPPVQGVVVLAGAEMDADGYDNPSYRGSSLLGPSFHRNCDLVGLNGQAISMRYGPGEIYEAPFLVRADAVNGVNFGDGISDNERLGMGRFIMCVSGVSGYGYQYPLDAPEYYQCMQGYWVDKSHMIYGGNGHLNSGGYGPACNFIFPESSDSCKMGTLGQVPFGPTDWTEKTAYNIPQDRRGVATTGPITFKPGETKELDLAFAWARGDNPLDSAASLDKLRTVVDTLRRCFIENRTPGGGPFYDIGNIPSEPENQVKVYPNPARDILYIELSRSENGGMKVSLLTIQARQVTAVVTFPGSVGKIDISSLPACIC